MADEDLESAEGLDEEMTEEERQMAELKEALNVQVEDIGTLRKKLTITVPEKSVTDRRSDQYSELKRDSIVPGFRKGRAPMRLIEKRFGQDVNEQLSSQLLSSSYLAAVEKEDLKIIGDPLIWAQKKESDHRKEKLVSVEDAFELITLPDEGDFTFSCEVEIRPEFDLPEIEGIKLTKPKTEISKAQIKEQIDRLRAMRGHYEPMPDARVQEDDLVICNLKITAGERVLLEEENSQIAARPMRYGGIIMEDLHQQLDGAKIGDNKQFKGQIPEDYEDESVRGQAADISVEILDIKRLRLPEVDDDFLALFGVENQQELEDWVRTHLEARQDEEIRHSLREQVREYLTENTSMDLPEGLSQRQTNNIASRRMLELSRRGLPEAEIIKQTDEIKAGARSDAVQDLQLFFVFEKISEEWDVDVTEDEINGQIAEIARRQNRRFDRVRDDLIRNKSLSSLYIHVRDEKIVDEIIARADVSEAAEKPGKKAPSAKPKQKTASKKSSKSKSASGKKPES